MRMTLKAKRGPDASGGLSLATNLPFLPLPLSFLFRIGYRRMGMEGGIERAPIQLFKCHARRQLF